MPALYPNVYSAQDQLDDLVYGASDYPNPNQQTMPTPGVAGGYSSMPMEQSAPVAPAAQYPPTTPPPAGANYVAPQQQAPAQVADPFAAPAGDYDAIDVAGNVGWHEAQQQPWSSTTAPLAPANPAPYTGPNYLSEPTGNLDTMPSQRGYGGSNLDQFQQQVNGRQVQPAPTYPATEPTVTQLPRTGDAFEPWNRFAAGDPRRDQTNWIHPVAENGTVATGTAYAGSIPQTATPGPSGGADRYTAPLPQPPATPEQFGQDDPFAAYSTQRSDIRGLDAQLPPTSPDVQTETGGGGWQPTLDLLTPLGTWATERGEDASRAGYNGPEAQQQQAIADQPTPDDVMRQRFGQFPVRRASPMGDPIISTSPSTSGGEVGGTSSGAQTPAASRTLAGNVPATTILNPDGSLAGRDAAFSSGDFSPGAGPPLMVISVGEDGGVSFDSTVIPEASYAAAAQRGEKAAALSDDEFNAIVAAGLMKNPDGSDLTPEQVEVWRQSIVGVPMLAPASWSDYIAPAPGSETPVTFTPEAPAAPVVADTSSPSSGNNWSGGNSGGGYRSGGGYSRGGGSSRGGGYSGGGGGDWYDDGGSYPPTMPASMADFFGPDAFDSPIFDRMRGMMRSGRRGRRRGRRGMMMPGMPAMPGRETPSRDVNLRVAGPVVSDELQRALALRNR